MPLPKPAECTKPKVSPNVNGGLWVIMMCECWCMDCNHFDAG